MKSMAETYEVQSALKSLLEVSRLLTQVVKDMQRECISIGKFPDCDSVESDGRIRTESGPAHEDG